MSETKVAQFAETVGTPVERLIEQMHSAGIMVKGPDSSISDEQKEKLLGYLRDKHGTVTKASPNKITLKRKTTSELTLSSSSSKSKSKVKVEVRKKRTYVKRSAIDEPIPSADVELLEARRVSQEAKKAEEETKAQQESNEKARQEIFQQAKNAEEQALADEEKKREDELAAQELLKTQEQETVQAKVSKTKEIEQLARKQTKPILKEAPRGGAAAKPAAKPAAKASKPKVDLTKRHPDKPKFT
ncbi:MAG: translation initiation factor IF-2 associated domain-containing protein, partial [gamma proteobacterium symbiont of Lucinoma myriamae]|nr:translation initiation factor IF-2 associated domain-containing protein [gamma proteobacterium symbiont of Lucinoma myriamae]